MDVPAADCIFEILRADLNSMIQYGKLSYEKLVYDEGRNFQAPDEVSQTARCSNMSSTQPSIQTSDCFSDFAPKTPTYIPDLMWASMHWPKGASTAVSELHKIAALAKGLSGRKLRALVTQTIYMYTVEEPCDLQEFFTALESVIKAKAGLLLCETKQAMDNDEHNDDTMAFLSKLEADNHMDVCNS